MDKKGSKLINIICLGLCGILLLTAINPNWVRADKGSAVFAAESNYPDIEPGETATVNQITIDGFEFFFDADYTVGKFANGDYWVLGPLEITKMTPEYDGCSNGWEVNPVVEGDHGFQGGGYGDGFDFFLVPELPYRADPTEGILSIVKTMRAFDKGTRPCIQRAVVLTVVPTIPRNNGDGVFRPPYVGTKKPYYYVEDLRLDLLPNTYEPVDNMPTLESLTERFSKLQMDHKNYQPGRAIRPKESMSDYMPVNAAAVNNAVLRLMMNDPIEDKMPLLINYVQYGIDKIHAQYLGLVAHKGGGHNPAHRITPAFAAVMLDMDEGKKFLSEATFFHGTKYFSSTEDGFPLWGEIVSSPNKNYYWDYVINENGGREVADPYRYIDGGRTPDGSYQLICSDAHKGEILCTHLMPALKEAWNATEWNQMQIYTDRWVYFGLWSLPDPAAMHDGNLATYGITYGIDKKTGLLIEGEGRYPEAHGTMKDGYVKSVYKSQFVKSMWDAYRTTIPGAETTPPYAIIISPLDKREVRGVSTLQTTAYGIHGIASVQYYLDGKAVGESVTEAQTESPFAYELDVDFAKIADGTHDLYTVATDHKGNTYQSKTITLHVANGTVTGDMNNDGVVNIVDLAFVARHIDKTDESDDWESVKKADMNNDNEINIVDLSTVARLIQ